MANQKTAKKNTSKSAAGNKKTAPKKASNSKPKTNTNSAKVQDKKSAADRQKQALILFAVSILMFAITLIKGESLWAVLHNFVFGLFGICSFVWPIIMIYLAVMLSLNKEGQSPVPKAIGVSVFTLLLEGIIHVGFNIVNFGKLGAQIQQVWEMRDEISPKSGGVLGALVGGIDNSYCYRGTSCYAFHRQNPYGCRQRCLQACKKG